jgi:hypothetical protein
MYSDGEEAVPAWQAPGLARAASPKQHVLQVAGCRAGAAPLPGSSLGHSGNGSGERVPRWVGEASCTRVGRSTAPGTCVVPASGTLGASPGLHIGLSSHPEHRSLYPALGLVLLKDLFLFLFWGTDPPPPRWACVSLVPRQGWDSFQPSTPCTHGSVLFGFCFWVLHAWAQAVGNIISKLWSPSTVSRSPHQPS